MDWSEALVTVCHPSFLFSFLPYAAGTTAPLLRAFFSSHTAQSPGSQEGLCSMLLDDEWNMSFSWNTILPSVASFPLKRTASQHG
jgi:hypothetical protein